MTVLRWIFPTIYTRRKHSANASNSPVRIVVKEGVPFAAAILAQERYEWRQQARIWLPCMILGGFLGFWAGGLVGMIVGVIVGLASCLVATFRGFARELEYASHAIEIEVAVRYYPGTDRAEYRKAEAKAINGYSHSYGRGWKVIEAELIALEEWAAGYVSQHHAEIERDKARVG